MNVLLHTVKQCFGRTQIVVLISFSVFFLNVWSVTVSP